MLPDDEKKYAGETGWVNFKQNIKGFLKFKSLYSLIDGCILWLR
jgi:hypothetical protein